MEFLILGVVSALNFIIIKTKLDKKRFEDAGFDFLLMGTLAYLFAGSYAGMVVAMVSSLVISIYLYFSPPRMMAKLFGKLKQSLTDVKEGKKDKKDFLDL